MYHGLRKALTTGVKQIVKDDSRVAAASDAFERLDKGVASLRWALDNCEATWTAQADFCKYMPLIAADMYASHDIAACDVIANYTASASALQIATSAPTLEPVRAELNALTERVKKLNTQRNEWVTCISDKAYYDEKYTKIAAIAAASEKNGVRDAEKEKRALLKKAQTADKLVSLTTKLADEFDYCINEKLAVADKVMLAVASTQSTNARRADIAAVQELMLRSRFGARNIPVPNRDDKVVQALTGVPSRRRSSADSTPPQSGLSTSVSAPVISAPPPPTDYMQPQTHSQHLGAGNQSGKSMDFGHSGDYSQTTMTSQHLGANTYNTNPYDSKPYGTPPGDTPNGVSTARPHSAGHRRMGSWNTTHNVDSLTSDVNNISFNSDPNNFTCSDSYTPSAPDDGYMPSAPPNPGMPQVLSTNGLFAFKPLNR